MEQFLFAAFLILAILLGLRPPPSEAFAVREETRPCSVYYTEDIEGCDAGKYVYNYAYYDNQLKKVKAEVEARGGTPTASQNAQILELTKTLSDLDRFPNRHYCKVTFPNWVQSLKDSPPTLGPIESNAARSRTEQWAFCHRAGADPNSLARTGMKLADAPDTINGIQHVRGTFDAEFNLEDIRKTYCEETKNIQGATIKRGIVVLGSASGDKKYNFYRNGVIADPSTADINELFMNSLYVQKSYDRGSYMEVVSEPTPRTYSIARMQRDICNRLIREDSSMVEVQFFEGIPLMQVTKSGPNQRFYGTTSELKKKRDDSIASQVKQQQQLNSLWGQYYSVVGQRDARENERRGLEATRNYFWLVYVNSADYQQVRRCWEEYYDQCIGPWICWKRSNTQCRWENVYTGTRTHYGNLYNDYANRQAVAQRDVNNYNTQIQNIMNQINQLNADMSSEQQAQRQYNEMIAKMDDTMQKEVAKMLKEKRLKVVVIEPPNETFKYMSYDGNYYIEL